MPETQKWKESDVSPPSGRSSSTSETGSRDYNAEIAEMRNELSRLSDSVSGSVQSAIGPFTQQFEAAIKRNPMGSVLVAAGVGLLFGLMNRRR